MLRRPPHSQRRHGGRETPEATFPSGHSTATCHGGASLAAWRFPSSSRLALHIEAAKAIREQRRRQPHRPATADTLRHGGNLLDCCQELRVKFCRNNLEVDDQRM